MKYRLVGATRFYERKEIKDALAYLRLIHNPADSVALNRVINTPPRGIGDKAQDALRSWAAELGVSQYVALQVVHHGPERAAAGWASALPPQAAFSPIGGRAQKALADFSELIEGWVDRERAGRYSSVAELLDDVLLQSRYLEILRDGTDEGEDRFENLQQLRAVAATYVPGAPDLEPGQTPLGMFLEQVSLVVGQRRPRDKRRRGNAADAAHGQGAGVPGRLYRRAGGRHLAAQPHPGNRGRPRKGGGAGRGAAAVLRGHHACQAAALPGACLPPQPVGRQQRPGAQPLPGRDPRRTADRHGRQARAPGEQLQAHDLVGRRRGCGQQFWAHAAQPDRGTVERAF